MEGVVYWVNEVMYLGIALVVSSVVGFLVGHAVVNGVKRLYRRLSFRNQPLYCPRCKRSYRNILPDEVRS